MSANEARWIQRPVYRGKTRTQVRTDTIIENFPLFCPIREYEIEYTRKPDAETQS